MSAPSCTYMKMGDGRAFEVEFVALSGKTVAVVTVPSDQTRAVREDEITHARAMATTE